MPKKVTKDTSGSTSEERKVLLTREGMKKLKDELDYLVHVRRKEVAKRLQEAISYGDLSENSEYEDAKNEQAFTEGRILELEDQIKDAKVIGERRGKAAIAQVGSRVVIKKLGTKMKKEGFTIVGSTEVDPLSSMISNDSPIGRALVGKKAGDSIEVVVPAGIAKYKIVSLN